MKLRDCAFYEILQKAGCACLVRYRLDKYADMVQLGYSAYALKSQEVSFTYSLTYLLLPLHGVTSCVQTFPLLSWKTFQHQITGLSHIVTVPLSFCFYGMTGCFFDYLDVCLLIRNDNIASVSTEKSGMRENVILSTI